MGKKAKRRPPDGLDAAKLDLDSFPNDPLEEQLAVDVQTVKAIERELTGIVGQMNLAPGWLRLVARFLEQNIGSAKAHRVDPLPTMSAERNQECRQETLDHSRGHAEEAEVVLRWYQENPEERRDQLPPWLKSRAEALAELQTLVRRSTPEGHLDTMTAELDRLRATVEDMEKKNGPAATHYRQRYEGCVRYTGLFKQFLATDDPDTKARLRTDMMALADEEALALKNTQHKATPARDKTKMTKPKTRIASPFTGRWRIVSMSAWEDEYLDEEVEAYIEFDAKGGGDFQFGYIQGQIDYRSRTRDGKPAVEFTWDGGDGADGTPLTGRAWATLQDDELHGEFCIHDGDDSEFVAKRTAEKKRPKRK